MPRITIDNQVVEAPAGTTVLDAAQQLGIDIPTLCFLEGRPPQTSCMVCLVRVDGARRLVPACATKVRDGMRIESETGEVRAARRVALELLLSDHLGDCIAPCQAVCPAHMSIPQMIRRIGAGDASNATAAAEPCEVCAAPCEKACRRAVKDRAVAIRLLVRYASDNGAQPPEPPPAERAYSVHVGRVEKDEIDRFMAEASVIARTEPLRGPDAGFTDEEAQREASRCLHCDCRRPDDCRLRKAAALTKASTSEYKGERRAFEQRVHPQGVVYEPGKCIACGLCVEITRSAGETLGLTFIGRGFNVRVAVPFDQSLKDGLERTAAECVRACPTGALAFKNDRQEP